MEEKRFQEWMALKEKIHLNNSNLKISEGEVWWCVIGENVGVEINGKSEFFSRLYRYIGTVPDSDLKIVKDGLKNLYFT